MQRTRHLAVLCLGVITASGCYLSHGRPGGGDDDADVGGGADASPEAARDTLRPIIDGCVGEECFVAAELDGLRWELPCTAPTASATVCETLENVSVVTSLRGGAPGARYRVTVRLRGVVETKDYRGGSGTAPLNEGGEPDGSDWNLYAIRVSDPPSRLFLNDGPGMLYHCISIDVTTTLTIRSGAEITLEAFVFDARQIRNIDERGAPFVIPDIDPAPDAYDGQFIQMDVVSVARR